jgi:hypothetical protein
MAWPAHPRVADADTDIHPDPMVGHHTISITHSNNTARYEKEFPWPE